MKIIKTKQLKWIDIEDPTELDLEYLRENFHFAPSVLKEYLLPIKRSKVDKYPDYLFIVLHFPVFEKRERQTFSAELDIFLTRETIITSHLGDLPQLERFFNDCNIHNRLRKEYLEKGTGFLLKVFQGKEKEMIVEISIVKRDIIDFRKTIKPQRTVLEILDRIVPELCQMNLKKYSQEVIGSNIRVWNILENHKEMIEAIEETNESLFYYKFNETLKILTVFSVIMLPLTLIASIFGMNTTRSMPFINSFFDFWLVILVMVVVFVFMTIYFKNNKWL